MSLEAQRRSSADPEVIDAFERRAAIPANHPETILANQRLRHWLAALGAIEGRLGRSGWLQLIHLSIIAVSLAGCLRLRTGEPAIGEAYVAPATLQSMTTCKATLPGNSWSRHRRNLRNS